MLKLALLISFLALPAQAEVFSYGVLGDAGVWNQKTRDIRQSMKAGHISSLILSGDNLYFGDYEDVWSHWDQFDFDVVAIGNHTAGYRDEVQYFNTGGEFYLFSPHPDIAFVVLNSDNQDSVEEQKEWLETTLQTLDHKFVLVVFHHPPYTVSHRHSWQEKEAFHLMVRPILLAYKHKISTLIVGHDHIASLTMIDSLPMIVSGASFETFRAPWVNYHSGATNIRTAWMYNGQPHWVRLDLNTKTEELWVNFVQANPSKVTCSALLRRNEVHLKSNCLASQRDEAIQAKSHSPRLFPR